MKVQGKKNQRLGLASLLLSLLLVASACGGADDTTTTEATTATEAQAEETTIACGERGGELEQTSLQIVVAPPEFDSMVNAIWFQNLEEAGITVETVDFAFGPDTVRALASGAGAIASTSPTPAMRFIQESGSALKVIAAELLNTDYALMVSNDIESVEDLKGKKIGISEPGDISETTTLLWLAAHPDIDIDDVEIVQIGGTSARLAAVVSGDIAGGPAHIASGLAAEQETGAMYPLANYWDAIPIYAQRYLVADPTWLEENPNLAQLAIDTFIEAQRDAQADKEAFIAIAQEYEPDLSVDIMDETYDFFRDGGFFAVNGGIGAIGPTNEADLSVGNLTEIPPESEWLDSSFVEEFLECSGEQ